MTTKKPTGEYIIHIIGNEVNGDNISPTFHQHLTIQQVPAKIRTGAS